MYIYVYIYVFIFMYIYGNEPLHTYITLAWSLRRSCPRVAMSHVVVGLDFRASGHILQ